MTSSRDSIRWYPRVTVLRYSPEQTRWAQCRLGKRHLHGDVLKKLFPRGPEDGIARDEGNAMVNGGLTNLINLLTGATPSGSAGRPLSLGLGGGVAGSACIGVGTDGSTAFAATQTHLANATGEGSSNSWYQSMDTGYPALSTPATINGQSTFQAGDANFTWNEWCYVTGAGVPTAGAVLGSVYATGGSAAMLNRKIPVSGLGTKGAGAAWVFQNAVTFSLRALPADYPAVIILGIVLLVLGFVLGFHLLWVIGAILLVIGLVFLLLGTAGRPVGGRSRWY